MAKKKLMIDLFERQLQNLYNSETLILKALPKMYKYATDEALLDIINAQINVTHKQKVRLEEIGRYLNIKVAIQDGNIIQGMLEDVAWLYEEIQKGNLMDAGLVSKLQNIQHFQISAYETAVLYAKNLHIREVSEKLTITLEEAYEADEYCSQFAQALLLKDQE